MKRTASPMREEDGGSKHRRTDVATSLQRAPEQPLVWAADRQSMCETLPTFKAYQGALYHISGVAKGILLVSDMGPSHLNHEVAIFRAPGKAGVGEGGSKIQTGSHSFGDAAVKAIVSTRNAASAVFLHVARTMQTNTKLPHPICSMGAYWITDVWPTLSDGQLSIWLRIQKVDLARSNWLVWEQSSPAALPGGDLKPEETVCAACEVSSPRRYKQMWLCLNHVCASFFRDKSGGHPALQSLQYDDAFVHQRPAYPHDLETVPSLVPERPDTNSATDAMWWMKEAARRGIVCPDCGQCLPRKLFKGWECEHCSYEFTPYMEPITIAKLLGSDVDKTYTEPETNLPTTTKMIGEWRATTFKLDEENAITLFQANSVINSAPGGSNDLFVALQQDDKLELKRFTLHNKASTDFLAAHYSQNFGMPYKYVVSTTSDAFSIAPDPILAVKARLAWGTQQVVGEHHDEYNELLAVGYFAGNHMGWHDDGEKDLGPNVTSLSLGSNSTFSFRVKRNYHQGFTGKFEHRKLLKDRHPIMPNSFLAEERKAIYDQNLPTEDHLAATEQLYDNYWEQLVAKHGEAQAKILAQRATLPKKLAKLDLHHGDMVLMSGPRIQQYLEHEAAGIDGLRYALTCREIRPSNEKERKMMSEVTHIPEERRSTFDGLIHHYASPDHGCELPTASSDHELGQTTASPDHGLGSPTASLDHRSGPPTASSNHKLGQPTASSEEELDHHSTISKNEHSHDLAGSKIELGLSSPLSSVRSITPPPGFASPPPST